MLAKQRMRPLLGISEQQQPHHGREQCSLKFCKVCVRIKYLLSNVLPELIWIWNDVSEICANTFLEETFLCAPTFLVCARLNDLCSRACARLK